MINVRLGLASDVAWKASAKGGMPRKLHANQGEWKSRAGQPEGKCQREWHVCLRAAVDASGPLAPVGSLTGEAEPLTISSAEVAADETSA